MTALGSLTAVVAVADESPISLEAPPPLMRVVVAAAQTIVPRLIFGELGSTATVAQQALVAVDSVPALATVVRLQPTQAAAAAVQAMAD